MNKYYIILDLILEFINIIVISIYLFSIFNWIESKESYYNSADSWSSRSCCKFRFKMKNVHMKDEGCSRRI